MRSILPRRVFPAENTQPSDVAHSDARGIPKTATSRTAGLSVNGNSLEFAGINVLASGNNSWSFRPIEMEKYQLASLITNVAREEAVPESP